MIWKTLQMLFHENNVFTIFSTVEERHGPTLYVYNGDQVILYMQPVVDEI